MMCTKHAREDFVQWETTTVIGTLASAMESYYGEQKRGGF